MSQLRVLLTGAAGRIGQTLTPSFRKAYQLRTLDRQPLREEPGMMIVDLTDAPALQRACADTDVIVHLAASPNDKWPFVEEIVPNNIVGLYNLLEAARQQRVRRVVFASSVQTVDCHPAGQTITVSDPVRPLGPYGASKVFGEALGRVYHDRHGLEFVALRLGAFQPYNPARTADQWAQEIWLSPADCERLFRCAVEKPRVGYVIVFGTSHTLRERLSRREAREVLGFEPQDRWPEHFAGKP
jgi:uronate dehydrogenase